MSDLDGSRLLARLCERGAELDEIDAAGEDAQSTVVLDQSRVGRLSRMDALQGQASAGALERLEQGHYGRCVDCDVRLSEGRLEIDPAAERCVHCAT